MTSAQDADVAERPTRVVNLKSLTSLRFVAAAVVLVHHAGWMWTGNSWVASTLDLGYVGVSFFFVLSGFVLTWSLSPTRTRRRFYWLRFARIWPLHAATLLYAGLAIASTEWLPGSGGTAAIATLTQGFVPHEHTYYGLNGVSWSLSCEAFFYALFPFFVAPLLRARTRTLVAIAVGALLWLLSMPLVGLALTPSHPWIHQHYEWLFFINPVYRSGEFVLGVVTACAFRRGWRPRFGLGGATVAMLLTTAVVVWVHHDSSTYLQRPYFALLLLPWFAVAIAGAATADVEGRAWLLHSPWLVFLGEASFALYMTHQLVQRTGDWSVFSGRSHHSFAEFAIFVFVSILVAALTHLLVERPAEQWLRRRNVGTDKCESPSLAPDVTAEPERVLTSPR